MESTQAWHVYHQYTIRTPRRDELAEHLKRRGIGTMVYYPVPIHQQPVYASYGKAPSLPHAEAAAKQVLSLPIYPEITDEQLETVAGAIRDFFSSYGSSAH
jgi:dTDP-4-amino-4,6-dideoxygalactose transaminase